MYYDEEQEKKKDRKAKILDTPMSDFELSVRSRNCLKKMKIHTLGDLLRTTESELLAYKNFGETSLREIKKILESKTLHLGMALEGKMPSIKPLEDENQPLGEDDKMLNKFVEELRLSVRAEKCLEKLKMRTLRDLTKITEAELLGCKNFGVTSLNEVKKALANIGLSLRSLEL